MDKYYCIDGIYPYWETEIPLHREDGPAIELECGWREYWYCGRKYSTKICEDIMISTNIEQLSVYLVAPEEIYRKLAQKRLEQLLANR